MAADPQTSSESSSSIQSTLLRGVRAHDPEAWQRLVQLFGPLVYSWARAQQLQPADASDVTQEVFQAVAINIDRFRREQPGDSFRGWLWTITRNKIRDFQRVKVRQPEAAGGTKAKHCFERLPEEPPPTSLATGKSNASFLRAVEAIRIHFESRTWQAFWKTAIDERPAADVATELQMSVPAVYKAKSRVLHRLREDFDGLID